MRANVLPKARSDFRLLPEEYALNLEQYGIDIPPAKIAAMAHEAFTEIQGEMQPIAARIAKEQAAATAHLGVGGQLDRLRHPRELAAL
jgi:precorrin-4 methylase